MTEKKRILSGNRPTGLLHLGNYFGALQNWERLQDEYECFFMIADWHALTSDYADTGAIVENIHQMMLDWLAIGLDPERSTIFIQSQVKQHAELALLLGMYTPLPWLERCPTYKEQIMQLENKDLSNFGFLGYPVLQAADIVIYRANAVPVGEDQLPHLELTREIVRRINNFHQSAEGPIFPEPQPLLSPTPKMMGIDGRKMSKSYQNCIYLADPAKDVAKKISRMVTDPQRVRRDDPGNPEVCSVFDYHKVATPPEKVSEIDTECRKAGIGCVDCKKILAANLNDMLEPIRARRAKLEAAPEQVKAVMKEGCDKARQAAECTMQDVRQRIKMIDHY